MDTGRRRAQVAALLAVALLAAGCSDPTVTSTPRATRPGTTSPTPGQPVDVVLPGAPERFVGVVDGRIAVVDARDGTVTRYLTAHRKGFSDVAPVLVRSQQGQQIYYLHARTHGCRSEVARVPLHGGRPDQVVAFPSRSWALSVSPDGRLLAYSDEPCNGRESSYAAHVISATTGREVFAVSARTTRPWPPVTLGQVLLTDRHLVVSAGVHLTVWLAVVSLHDATGQYPLRSLPTIPLSCPFNGLVASPSRARVYGTVACGSRRSAVKVFTATGSDLQHVTYSAPLHSGMDWLVLSSRSRSGALIGRGGSTRSGDIAHIVQVSGRGVRVLPACGRRARGDGACAGYPTWSTL